MPKSVPNNVHKDYFKRNYFRARLMGQLLVVFIYATLVGQSLILSLTSLNIGKVQLQFLYLALPFMVALALIVIFKYVAFQKMGCRILKYSGYLDIFFSLIFTAEWILSLNATLQTSNTERICYSLFKSTGLLSFSWRTLLPVLITQEWKLRILPPIGAYIYYLYFAVKHEPTNDGYLLMIGIFQLLYIILIFYFEHKVNFTLLFGNIQQEQWLKLNEFILDNIPENIAIMDLNGNCIFTNENFKRLVNIRSSSQDVKQFFRSINEIQQMQRDAENESADSIIDIITMDPCRSLSKDNPCVPDDKNFEAQTISSLEELIIIFGTLINKGSVKEKSLKIFNGKFKKEGNSEERSFQIHISFMNNPPNKYILLIIRDTTQRDLLLTLEGNMRYKDQLLASVSHELRTPLNGNINLLEAAIKCQEGVCEQVKKTLLMPALKSSKFLLYLINDILDMSQIKVQKLRLIFQQTSLRETLVNTIQLLELHAKKKGVNLQVDLHPELPEIFCTDHIRLSQIIMNLVNNSIKFTQKGQVSLSASPLRDSNHIQVSVEDSGIGMSEEDVWLFFSIGDFRIHAFYEKSPKSFLFPKLEFKRDLVVILII